MSEFERHVFDAMRENLDGHQLIALGLWCGLCGADTFPGDGHWCWPKSPVLLGLETVSS